MAGIGQSTDILDEDAADLQFPKDDVNIETDWHGKATYEVCGICRNSLSTEPKILCAESRCSTPICLQCFSHGLETQTHRNHHNYQVNHLHIPLDDDSDWTPLEDVDLLNALIEFGYGNYIDLGKRLPHRTTDEIRRRSDVLCKLDKAPLKGNLEWIPQPVLKWLPCVVSEEPPRYPARSNPCRALAGYNPARGDFDYEHDDNAEEIVAALSDDSDNEDLDSDPELTVALKCTTVEIYNERLKERFRRKRFIRDHAFLLRKFQLVMSKYSPKMFIFMQLLSGDDFENTLDGLQMEERLRKEFTRFAKYRSLGIKSLHGSSFFEKLNNLRTDAKRQAFKFSTGNVVSTQRRREAKPLDITSYPLSNKLTDEEKELCSISRIVPENYLKCKEILVTENLSKGSVKLMAARVLLKIDVNKTRKIYNFLINNGTIRSSN